MLCDSCRERDAVVHLTQIVDNAVSVLHLCEKCAAERGVETTVAMPKPSPLGDLIQSVHTQLASTPAETGRCTFCNATLRDFRATGRLGCAHCYRAFEGSLRELLRRVHGSSRHVGRRYEAPASGSPDERLTLLGELRDRLRRAIESEQFELAASLRDKIREHE